MANQLFNTVVSKIPKKNLFRMPFPQLLSAQYGAITPAGVFELHPGDVFQDQLEASIKLAPMKAPPFAQIDATFHYFFIPRRLVYSEFEEFVTGGTTGTFAEDVSPLNPVAPCFDFQELAEESKLTDGSLQDYMGMPSVDPSGTYVGIPPIDAMPWLAYRKVFSDWYRDELLDTDEFEPVGSGKIDKTDPLFDALTSLKYRAWHKDYFTSARPDTQLGPEVGVPLSGDVIANGPLTLAQQLGGSTNAAMMRKNYVNEYVENPVIGNSYAAPLYSGGSDAESYYQYYQEGLTIENALMLINDLRKSVRLQEWREKNMRGGNRYIESMFHHFGVKSSDARLQRSQYLGGKKVPVVIGEVLQSVNTTEDTMYSDGGNVLGTRGGVAGAAGGVQKIRFFAEEHGFVLCLMSILPHAMYFQGIPRFLGNRWDPMEYLWPEFGNLGEQEVFNWELFVGEGANAKNDATFGYQSRYADMKTRFGEIHGEFRNSLDFWHTARIFENRPNLNKNFIYFDDDDEAEGQNRIFAVTSNQLAAHFYVFLWHHHAILRLLPKWGIPSL